VCTLFYQVSPTLHAPATMVAVTTLADGGGRVTVGGGGRRATHCRGQNARRRLHKQRREKTTAE
jgi:hypothetical protein